MVELKVGEPNDVPGQSTLEPGGCDARARTFHCTSEPIQGLDLDERAPLLLFSSVGQKVMLLFSRTPHRG